MANAELSVKRLSPEARAQAIKLLKIASVLQFTVFGVPSVYYGDEAGLEGYHDPFCRMPYPWGREEASLVSHYKMLGALRKTHRALRDGDFRFLYHDEDCVVYERTAPCDRVLVAVNMNPTLSKSIPHLSKPIPPMSFVVED